MTGLTATAIRAVRARFGDDADAVMALRAAHKTVRPFGDGYAVDEQPVDSAELNRMADAINARRDTKVKRTKQKTGGLENPSIGKSAGTTDRADGPGSALADPIQKSCGGRGVEASAHDNPPPRGSPTVGAGHDQQTRTVADRRDRRAPDVGNVAEPETGPESAPRPSPPQDTIAATCPCSRPKGHGGRCWVSRGMAGPPPMRRKQPVATCSGCEGPRSPSAIGPLCRKCVLAKHRKSSGMPARIMALECEVDALKSANARGEKAIAELRGRLDQFASEGR
jgi:hypothetical protein